MTFRHLCTRVSEQFNNSGTMTKHIEEYGFGFGPMENSSILDSTQRNMKTLQVLEALYIKILKPTINNRDEYRSRHIRLRFWVPRLLLSQWSGGWRFGGIVSSTSTYAPTIRRMANWLTAKVDYDNLLWTYIFILNCRWWHKGRIIFNKQII